MPVWGFGLSLWGGSPRLAGSCTLCASLSLHYSLILILWVFGPGCYFHSFKSSALPLETLHELRLCNCSQPSFLPNR